MRAFITGLGTLLMLILLLAMLAGVVMFAVAAFEIVSLLCVTVLGWGPVASWFAGIGAVAAVVATGGVSYND